MARKISYMWCHSGNATNPSVTFATRRACSVLSPHWTFASRHWRCISFVCHLYMQVLGVHRSVYQGSKDPYTSTLDRSTPSAMSLWPIWIKQTCHLQWCCTNISEALPFVFVALCTMQIDVPSHKASNGLPTWSPAFYLLRHREVFGFVRSWRLQLA